MMVAVSVTRNAISARSRVVATGSKFAVLIVSESGRRSYVQCLRLIGNDVGVVKRDESNRDFGRFMGEGGR